MAENEYVNKVIFNNRTLIDTSGVSVTPNNMTLGTTALDASGQLITGALTIAPLYNGIDKTTEGYALDARQGKFLNDKIDNLGLPIRYDAEQAIPDNRKQIARENISAASASELNILKEEVKTLILEKTGLYIGPDGGLCQVDFI